MYAIVPRVDPTRSPRCPGRVRPTRPGHRARAGGL